MPEIRPWLLALIAVVGVMFPARVFAQYEAKYRPAPVPPLTGDQTATLVVTVTNTGTTAWNNTGRCAVVLGHHWYRGQTKVAEDSQGAPLPIAVAPGQSVEVSVPIEVPSTPGLYTLAWDLRGNCQWFSSFGVAPGVQSNVEVRARR